MQCESFVFLPHVTAVMWRRDRREPKQTATEVRWNSHQRNSHHSGKDGCGMPKPCAEWSPAPSVAVNNNGGDARAVRRPPGKIGRARELDAIKRRDCRGSWNCRTFAVGGLCMGRRALK